jgi:subtilase family serine protease
LLHRSRRYLRTAGALALVSGSLFAGGAPAVAAAGTTITPMLISRFVSPAQVPTPEQCLAYFTEPCYDPAQLQTAYNVQPLYNRGITGRGETIVIVDEFGSPTIKSDLATFDAAFGLPAPPSFRIISPAGPIPRYKRSNSTRVSWAGETTLDVDWSHAMAPGANILLVETPAPGSSATAGLPQINEAENYVIDNHLGQVISQSFGMAEQMFPSNEPISDFRSDYINAEQQGVTVLAATGDTGATSYSNNAGTLLYTHRAVDWPATDPLVTAVGGTDLALYDNGQRTEPDEVWNDGSDYALLNVLLGSPDPSGVATGGGVSSVFGRPSYQNGVARIVGDHRGIPDIAMSAACSGLVLTYDSFGSSGPVGWYESCGTSEATPLFAAIVALADQVAGHSLGLINPALYRLYAEHAPGLVDVTQGNNTVTFTQNNTTYTVNGYSAGPGYDLASGVGTVNAALFVPELAKAAGG